MTRNKEIWGMALWLEKQHGGGGHAFITDRISAFEAKGEPKAVDLWLRVKSALSNSPEALSQSTVNRRH